MMKILEMRMRLKWHKSGVSAFLLGMLLCAGLACAQAAGLGLEGLLREGQAYPDVQGSHPPVTFEA